MVSMSSLTSQSMGSNAVPDRQAFAHRLPHDWTPEKEFKDTMRRIGRIDPWDNARLAGALHSLFYYQLVQAKRLPSGGRLLRALTAEEGAQLQKSQADAAARRPVFEQVTDPATGDTWSLPPAKAAEKRRQLRKAAAQKELARIEQLRRDAEL